MIHTVKTSCPVMKSLAAEMEDRHPSQGAALRCWLNAQPGVQSALQSAHENARHLLLRAARWVPSLMQACGMPEDIAGELTLLGADTQALPDVATELHVSLIEIDDSAADYNAYRAIADARWIARHFEAAVCDLLNGETLLEVGDIAEAVQLFQDAARSIVRMASTETAPCEADLAAWLRSECEVAA